MCFNILSRNAILLLNYILRNWHDCAQQNYSSHVQEPQQFRKSRCVLCFTDPQVKNRDTNLFVDLSFPETMTDQKAYNLLVAVWQQANTRAPFPIKEMCTTWTNVIQQLQWIRYVRTKRNYGDRNYKKTPVITQRSRPGPLSSRAVKCSKS